MKPSLIIFEFGVRSRKTMLEIVLDDGEKLLFLEGEYDLSDKDMEILSTEFKVSHGLLQ